MQPGLQRALGTRVVPVRSNGATFADPLRIRPWTSTDITTLARQYHLEVLYTTPVGSEDVLVLKRMVHATAADGPESE